MDGKVCFKCGRELSLDNFYAHPKMKDGYLGKCKDCTKRDVRLHRRSHDSVRAYDRRRHRDNPERRAKNAEGVRRRRQEDPDKARTRNAVNNAVRDGRLSKPRECSECGRTGRIEGHHEDYSRPLDVVWLCALCHRRLEFSVP